MAVFDAFKQKISYEIKDKVREDVNLEGAIVVYNWMKTKIGNAYTPEQVKRAIETEDQKLLTEVWKQYHIVGQILGVAATIQAEGAEKWSSDTLEAARADLLLGLSYLEQTGLIGDEDEEIFYPVYSMVESSEDPEFAQDIHDRLVKLQKQRQQQV